ncbi:MAG: cytochrome C [Planctomycetes bacterium]|nr:cytochrome C [Planctomycetota bacterium]
MADPIIPVANDLPLALPLPAPVLSILLVLLFALHIVFVNLMLGGTLLALAFELLGLRDPRHDRLARVIAGTVTVTKSLAVVLGVGPLLLISLLYTLPFYAANRATGQVWFLIVPMTALAFLLSYWHKYAWDRLAGHKAVHLAIGGMAALLLLLVPLVFLVNVQLMMLPGRWQAVQQSGFLSGLLLDGVLARYLHFLLATLAATGLFLVWYLTRPAFDLAGELPGETRAGLRRRFYTLALVASLLQFVAGPLLLLTLPPQGLSWLMLLHIGLGAGLAAWALWWMWGEIVRADDGPEALGWRFWRIVLMLGAVVLAMATGRQLYRATILAPYQAQVAERTRAHQQLSAHYRAHPAPAAEEDPLAALPGYAAARQSCMACHAVDTRLVGPPMTEIAALYPGPEGIEAMLRYVRQPTQPRKVRDRAEYPATMPPVGPGQADDASVRAIAGFMQEAARR